MLRCPFNLQRLIRVTNEGKVIYLAERKACRRFPKPASPDLFGGSPGVSRNFQVFDPLDFIAELTQHTTAAARTPTARLQGRSPRIKCPISPSWPCGAPAGNEKTPARGMPALVTRVGGAYRLKLFSSRSRIRLDRFGSAL